ADARAGERGAAQPPAAGRDARRDQPAPGRARIPPRRGSPASRAAQEPRRRRGSGACAQPRCGCGAAAGPIRGGRRHARRCGQPRAPRRDSGSCRCGLTFRPPRCWPAAAGHSAKRTEHRGGPTNLNDKLTRKSHEALSDAVKRAAAAGNPSVDGLHLLAALIEQDGGIAAPLLRAVGADPGAVLKDAKEQLSRLPRAAGATVGAPETSRPLLASLATADKRAKEMSDEYVSTEHLLVGLAADGGQAATILREAGAGPDQLLKAFEQVRGRTRVTSPDPEGTYQALEKYGVDLTRSAREGKLDPVIGRDAEIRRVI